MCLTNLQMIFQKRYFILFYIHKRVSPKITRNYLQTETEYLNTSNKVLLNENYYLRRKDYIYIIIIYYEGVVPSFLPHVPILPHVPLI